MTYDVHLHLCATMRYLQVRVVRARGELNNLLPLRRIHVRIDCSV